MTNFTLGFYFLDTASFVLLIFKKDFTENNFASSLNMKLFTRVYIIYFIDLHYKPESAGEN